MSDSDEIDRFDSGADDTDIGEQETPLREIAKAIERLEKAGVTVPDVLRAEKTRLAAALSIHADATQALTQLVDEIADILGDQPSRLGLDQVSDVLKPDKKARKRSNLPKTDPLVPRDHIVRALQTLGAKGRAAEVVQEMGHVLA
jgi:hypothetical protein